MLQQGLRQARAVAVAGRLQCNECATVDCLTTRCIVTRYCGEA